MSVLRQIKKNSGIKYDHPAIISQDIILSYSELENRIKLLAEHFHSLGIKEKNKVVILSSNNPHYVLSILALWEMNACVIPLNTRLADTELTELIINSDADFLLEHKNEKRNLAVNIPKIIFPVNSKKRPAEFKAPGINPDEISLIMFTSGATGKPRGVMHSLRNLLNSADNSESFLSQKTSDRWLASLPFFHIGGLSIITRTFRFGSTFIIPLSLKNKDLKNAFDFFKPTLASLVSTQLKRLLETGWEPGPSLKHLLLGGGIIEEGLIKEAISAGCKLSNVYGSTETCAFVTENSGANLANKPASAGKALGNNKIFIVKNKSENLPLQLSGEICIESNSLFHGYYKDEETTAMKLKDGKYFTGDIGFIDSGGDLIIEARRTDLIISGGENVNPVEVENILNKIPEVKESCVFALEDKEWGQIVAAAIVLDKNISIKDLAENLKGKIASYKIPKRFFPVETIPKTPLGKIKREQIREEINLLIN
ncbi:MAG TPA: o-succinylbenzoate--CoA ligase [Ignavibacteriaceae bacterium]|nr:o-succinylbenzoate--CoA ligase [Ignavibacteriaceae bacterium]